MSDFLNVLANGIGDGIKQFGNYSAQAAARANAVSAGAQAAQGSFNQASANNANSIGADRIAEQYAFNSGQAAAANDFTSMMWDRSAAWNEEMFNRQMEFNREEAQKNRDWQERMMSTSYQRAVGDMEKAGLNPILAVTGGGISTGSGGGSAASVSAPSMGGANGQMASGGLMNGVSASESSYTGQMEYMGGMLGLLGAVISSLATAQKTMDQYTSYDHQGSDYSILDFVKDIWPTNDDPRAQKQFDRQKKNPNTKFNNIYNKITNRWSNGDYNPYDED